MVSELKGKITSILLFKAGNMLTSYGKNEDFNIQEWVINENFSNIKSDNTEDTTLNKSNNESEINENISLTLNKSVSLEPSTIDKNSINQISINNCLYEKANSFYSEHKDDINVMVEMSNSMFASGGKDKLIKLWKD